MRFSGKIVAVTGAAQGIGNEIAFRFAKEDALIYICDLDAARGADAVRRISEAGGKASFLKLDVTAEVDWIEAVSRIDKERGRLDVLVNNAGISIRRKFEEYEVEAWDKMMAVNVRGVFLGMKHSIPLMRRGGGGSIVNVASIAGLIGHRYSPIAYIATKGAVTMMTKGVAVQYAGDNIRANTVNPSTVETTLVAELFSDPQKKAERLGEIPLGRLAATSDVANAVLFLASDEASFITGASLPIDGGLTAS
jgi:NAD(P)-dependent dehydrogenase (short-subunit alcohol dehydrogenase family)